MVLGDGTFGGWHTTHLVLVRVGLHKAPRLIAFQAEFNQGLRSLNVE